MSDRFFDQIYFLAKNKSRAEDEEGLTFQSREHANRRILPAPEFCQVGIGPKMRKRMLEIGVGDFHRS